MRANVLSLREPAHARHEASFGRPSSEPLLEITIPTLYDPTLAPPGKHVMSIFAQYAPYRLGSGVWDDAAQQTFVDRCIDRLSAYAPNVRGAIEGCMPFRRWTSSASTR